MVLGRKGKSVEQVMGQERMGCFEDTRHCWAGAAF